VRYDPNKIDLGNVELTKLWNIEPDMLVACRSEARKFVPTVENFIRDPLEELDPEQEVEDKYRSVNQEAFQWRASRFLMTESPQYILSASLQKGECTQVMPYLATVIMDSAKTIPSLKPKVDEIAEHEEQIARKKAEAAATERATAAEKAAAMNKPTVASNGIENGDEKPPVIRKTPIKQEPGITPMQPPNATAAKTIEAGGSLAQITKAQLRELATSVESGLDQLALALSVSDDRLHVMREKYDKPHEIVAVLLTEWIRKEGDQANVKQMHNLLLQAELLNEKVSAVLKSFTTKKSNNRK